MRLAPGHDAAGSGQNIDSESTEDTRNLLAADVHTAAGAGDALDGRNYRLAVGRVLKVNTDEPPGTFFGHFVIADIAFVFQNLGDINLQPGRGHIHFRVACAQGVPDTREHVGDRIRCHPSIPSWLPTRLDHARDLPGERELSEADPADAEFANVTSRPSAAEAAVPVATA